MLPELLNRSLVARGGEILTAVECTLKIAAHGISRRPSDADQDEDDGDHPSAVVLNVHGSHQTWPA